MTKVQIQMVRDQVLKANAILEHERKDWRFKLLQANSAINIIGVDAETKAEQFNIVGTDAVTSKRDAYNFFSGWLSGHANG